MRSRTSIPFMVAAGLVGWLGSASAQASTCTTINVPVTITSPGVYCFIADQTLTSASAIGVLVQASGVVVDLGGYRLRWQGASASLNPGIKIDAGFGNVVIRNGLVSAFKTGVEILGDGAIVEDMRLHSNELGVAVRSGATGALIRRNYIRFGNGVQVDAGADTGFARIVDNDFHGLTTTQGQPGSVGVTLFGMHPLVEGNRFGRFYQAIVFDSTIQPQGKFRDNLTNNVTVLSSGGYDVGNNN